MPGALLTMMGLTTLHSAFNFHQLHSPASLLQFLDEDMNRKLSHRSTGRVMNDGMDITICEIDRQEMVLTIAGANSTVCLVRQGEMYLLKTDKYNMGNVEPGKEFGSQKTPLEKGDMIYLFSDGFIDQFGGISGKKVGSKRFRDLLLSVSSKTMKEQENTLRKMLSEWQGTEEQTDDITVMGIRI
jgi:serine phosphatase RsbU (regulator of sigma subunit)